MARTMVVRAPLRPPLRLTNPLRYRSSKLRYDLSVWSAATAGVRDLLASGWRVEHVHVDWGHRIPGLAAWREEKARELTQCVPGCDYAESAGVAGRGETMWTMVYE